MRFIAFVAPVIFCGSASACSSPTQVSRTPAPFPVAQDLPSLVRDAPTIIVGRVTGIQAGRTAGEGEGQFRFNDVRITVEKRLKGKVSAEVIVEQLAKAGPTVTSEVGRPYEPGQRYVLFLRPGEGVRYIASTQGRYLLRDGAVQPTEPGPVADKVKGMNEAKFIAGVEDILGRMP